MSIFDLLKKRPEVWELNGAVFRLLKDGGTQTFTPRLPEDLETVKLLVIDLNRARAGKGEFPELAAETAEEALIGLIKPPETSPSPKF